MGILEIFKPSQEQNFYLSKSLGDRNIAVVGRDHLYLYDLRKCVHPISKSDLNFMGFPSFVTTSKDKVDDGFKIAISAMDTGEIMQFDCCDGNFSNPSPNFFNYREFPLDSHACLTGLKFLNEENLLISDSCGNVYINSRSEHNLAKDVYDVNADDSMTAEEILEDADKITVDAHTNFDSFLSFDYEPTNNVKPNERLFDFHGCELDTENIKETFEVLDFDPDEYSDAPGQIVRTIFKGEELSTELLRRRIIEVSMPKLVKNLENICGSVDKNAFKHYSEQMKNIEAEIKTNSSQNNSDYESKIPKVETNESDQLYADELANGPSPTDRQEVDDILNLLSQL